MTVTTSAFHIDEEVALGLATYGLPSVLTLEILPAIRDQTMEIFSLAAVVGDGPFTHAVHKITSSDGSEIDLSVFTPTGDAAAKSTQGKRPLIYFIHPGGLIINTQFVGASVPLSLAKDIGAVVISMDYRLAPEHKARRRRHRGPTSQLPHARKQV